MGISIEQYRNRIGTFNMGFRGPKSKKFNANLISDRKTTSEHLKLKLCILLLVVGLSSTLSSFQVSSSSYKVNDKIRGIQTVEQITQPYIKCDVNFEARYKFGNRRRQGINICHWNKGGGYLTNRINEIENVIDTFRPHLLGISEANVWKNHDIQDIQIENYNVHLAKSIENPNYHVSRVVVYTHKDLCVKIRHNLMNDTFRGRSNIS